MRFAWTFNFDYRHYMLAGVIWVIGWCMILLAALVRLPLAAVAAFGVADHRRAQPPRPAAADARAGRAGEPLRLAVARPLPRGPISGRRRAVRRPLFARAVDRRDGARLRVRRGHAMDAGAAAPDLPARSALGATARVRRAARRAGLRRPEAVGRRLGTRVPEHDEVSGVAAVPADDARPDDRAVPLARTARGGRVAAALAVFGRVPLFYYVLHIPLIHVAACVVSARPHGPRRPVALREPPDDAAAAPAGTSGACRCSTRSRLSSSRRCISRAAGLESSRASERPMAEDSLRKGGMISTPGTFARAEDP